MSVVINHLADVTIISFDFLIKKKIKYANNLQPCVQK